MMMNRKTKKNNITTLIICHIIGFIFVNAFAAFAHSIAKAFPNIITQALLPNNYSLGEQVKLLVTPMFIVFVAEYFVVGKRMENFIPAHLTIAACLPIVTLGIYHIHEFVFKNPLSVDGPHIVLAVALFLAAFLVSTLLMIMEREMRGFTVPALTVYIIILIAFVIFSFTPPHGATFYDTINQGYGPAFH